MRRTYWSCTSFADWLRGTKKLESGSSKEWNEWRKIAESAHKVRYWLAEEGLDYIQDFVMWPIDKLYAIKYWLVNRFVTKTHALTASSLKPGEWQEFETRVLHCLFDELVNFVEVEKAWSHVVWSSKEDRKQYNIPWHGTGWFRIRTWRSPQAGLDHLDWESQLTIGKSWGVDEDDPKFGQLTHQAVAAQELSALYHWWKYERPARSDPYDAGGWTAICDRRTKNNSKDWLGEDETPEERAESRQALDLTHEIEKRYDDEDTEMLIRLVKIRQRLWT